LTRLIPGECRICDAAHNDPLDNVSDQENDIHESEHVPPSTAHYLRATGRVVRLSPGNRWVNRPDPAQVRVEPSGHLTSCEPEQYDSDCQACRDGLRNSSDPSDRIIGTIDELLTRELEDECPWCHCGADDCPTPRELCCECNGCDAGEDCAGNAPETVTDEAYRLVMGDRQSDYNHPSNDFKATGRQWAAVLTNWLNSEGMTVANEEFPTITGDVPDIPPRIVALMMAQLKISRESHKPKRDNRVDAIGYVLCADRIEEGY
jgi:hypothetical protein